MAFLRLDEFVTVNTQYIVKVKWKLSSENDELSGSVFVAGGEKTEVVAVRGEAAYKLWDILHPKEDLPCKPVIELTPAEWQRLRQGR